MQQIAAWLSARTVNAIAATVGLFLIGPPLSGGVCVLAVLNGGLRGGLIVAGAAAAILTALSPLLQLPASQTLVFAIAALGGAVIVGQLLLRTGSVTFTAQVTVVIAIVGIVLVGFFGPEPTVLWESLLENLRSNMEASGLQVNFDEMVVLVAPFVTAFVDGVIWLGAMLAMYIGYGAYGLLPAGGFRFGRFRHLNLGRVLAALTAVMSLVAALGGSNIAASITFLMVLAFILEGLGFCHWFVASRGISPFLLLVLYFGLVLTFRNGLLMLLLSVLGYVDAWFDLRRRLSVEPS